MARSIPCLPGSTPSRAHLILLALHPPTLPPSHTYTTLAAATRVVEYLQRVDPDAAAKAKARYACFDRWVPVGGWVGAKGAQGGRMGAQRGWAKQ